MKLTDKLKKGIDEYFDNISSEELYKLSTEKYKFPKMKTAEDFLKEGNEGLPLRLIIDNLTDEEILETMRDYASYCVKQTVNQICMENDKFVDFLKYFNNDGRSL